MISLNVLKTFFINKGYNLKRKGNRSLQFINGNNRFVIKKNLFGRIKITDVSGEREFQEKLEQMAKLNKVYEQGYLSSTVYYEILNDVHANYIYEYEDALRIKILNIISSYADNESLKKKNLTNNTLSKLKYLLVILPKASRKELVSDLEEMILEMRAESCNKYYIGFIVALHIISVLYHALFFKLQGYFYRGGLRNDTENIK